MATLEYFVVCRSISVDLDNDELTLGGVLEDIAPDFMPYLLDRMFAISSWRVDESEVEKDHQAILRVTLPGDEPFDFPMNLAPGRTRYRAIQSVASIFLEQTGEIICEVLLNGSHAASHHITIHPPREASESSDS